MSYITAEALEKFVNRYPEDATLVTQHALAAEKIIRQYLGYNPELAEYTTKCYGDDGYLFELEAFPLVELKTAEVNGNALDTSLFRAKGRNYIEYGYGKSPFAADSLYSFTYTAGWEEVPADIVDCGLRIASLLWESEQGNIAVTSVSYGDAGGRSFQNLNPDRILKDIESYRILTIG